MIKVTHLWYLRVKLLTATAVFMVATGCGYINTHLISRYSDTCKTHTHIRMVLRDYLSRRYQAHSPVRLGIVPFSVAANLAAQNTEHQGLGEQLAWRTHQEFLQAGAVPIVEVLNRSDWPGKKDEFFSGNFGGLTMAREAGYDLVLTAYVEPLKSMDQMTAHVKLIEVESGITVWYGTVVASNSDDDINAAQSSVWLATRRPDKLAHTALVDRIATCTVKGIVSEEE